MLQRWKAHTVTFYNINNADCIYSLANAESQTVTGCFDCRSMSFVRQLRMLGVLVKSFGGS